MKIIKSPEKAFALGFITISLGYFFGFLWSQNYNDFMLNGYNHLWIVSFGVVMLIFESIIDNYYKNKKKRCIVNSVYSCSNSLTTNRN